MNEVVRAACLLPTVVDDWRERFGACNGKAARELDVSVARMAKPGDKQKKETVQLPDERKAAGFRQRFSHETVG